MVTNTYVDIFYPEAEIYADLTGIEHDLRSARDLAKQIRRMPLTPGENVAYGSVSLIEALTTSALIYYWRAFSEGVRRGLTKIEKDSLANLSPELFDFHQKFHMWRDKHIAHSVNNFEENQPHARYILERQEEGFIAIGCTHSRVIGMSKGDAEAMLYLTGIFLEIVEKRKKQEEESLLKFVQKKPVAEVMRFKEKMFVRKPDEIEKNRKKLR
jgi:hypothetical protein